MRHLLAASLLLPAAAGLLYACNGDDPATATSNADAGVTPTPPPATPPTPPPPSPIPDAGPDAPPPYTPLVLGGKLVVWLDADQGYTPADGGTTWKDRSPQANDAKQMDDTRTPYRVDGGADGGLASRGVIHFSGAQFLEIADNASLQWGSSDFGFYVVTRFVNDPVDAGSQSYGIVWGKWTNADPLYPGLFVWANYPYNTKTSITTRLDTANELQTDGGMNDGTLRLVSVRRTGNHFETRINGIVTGEIADAGNVDAAAFDGVGRNAVIGGRLEAFQALVGDVAEIVGLKGTVTDPEQAALEAYLKSKYGL